MNRETREKHEKLLYKDECYLIQGVVFEVYRCFQSFYLIRKHPLRYFHLDFQQIKVALSGYYQLIMGFGFANFQQHTFHLSWKNVYTANNNHIIAAAGHFSHPHMSPPAQTRFHREGSNIACAITDNR
ncbi:MAG: hypothetical protein DDT30_00382 [Dehalococcoidia bacterium]|nr:hypothetical protein [Bacillota bacterium]MBT9141958.1 hypothetical protein [Bacillota bacterium]